MSSISSTQSGLGLAQFLQNIYGNTTTANSNSSSGTVTSTTTTAPQQKGHHHGAAFDKLANAITNALQSASSSGTAATDPNQTITQALEKIFKNGSLGSASGTDTDAESDTDTATTPPSNNAAPTASTTTTAGLPASFVQALQSFGVTAQQFQTDFTNALKNAQQSGSVDISTALKSFPVGSIVDSIG